MEAPSVMVPIAGYCLAIALACIAVGLPFTAIRRSSLGRPLDALFDAFATGLVVLLVELTILNWLGGLWFGLSVVALAAVVVLTLRRQGFAGLPPVVRRLDPWALATAAVLAGATLIRLRSVNFIARGGDAGGYVNWANGYARTGVLRSGFPPLFPMFLGVCSRLFGFAHTTDAVPLLGVFLLLATLRLLSQLGAPAVVKVAATVFVGLHTHAVWYASFPMSEALQAPLIVMLLSNLVAIAKAPRDRLPVGELLTLGFVALAIGLCRVTAPLLVVPMFVLLAASLARPWRAFTAPLAAATAAITAGVAISYLYGITAIRPYYVGNQIGGTVSAKTFSRLDRYHLLEVGPVLVGLMVAGVAALAALAWLTRSGTRWASSGPTADEADDASPGASPWWWPVPLTALIALGGAVVVRGAAGSDVDGQLHRIGFPLVVLAGLALLVPRAVRGTRGLTAAFGAVIGILMVQVNVDRFPKPLPHVHFLYWDRYLFSEVFPMAVVVVALGASALIEAAAARWPATEPRRIAPAVVAASLVPLVLAAAAGASTLRLVRAENAMVTLAGTYEFEHRLIQLMPEESAPILWTTAGTARPEGFFFPNTWYTLGQPLRLSWGRTMPNVPLSKNPFLPEITVSRAELAQAVACSPDDLAYVVEVDTGGELLPQRLRDPRLAIRKLGTSQQDIPHLEQPLGAGWKVADVKADVYAVTGDVSHAHACPPPT